MTWIAGYNNPGYLPESEPEEFQTFDEARDYLTWTLDQFAEDCVEDWDIGASESDEYSRAIHFFSAAKPSSISLTAGRYAFWIEEQE